MQRIILLYVFALVLGLESAAQNEGSTGEKLWYGGGFNLGISGATGQSAFSIGIAPMVGYKIAGPFSAGPRVSINYTHFRVRLPNNEIASANPLSWSAGLFGRAKFARNIFGHLEYELAETASIASVSIANGLEIWRRQHGNTFLGAGYTSGNTFATEILLLYNLTPPNDQLTQPFVVRFGFTYRF